MQKLSPTDFIEFEVKHNLICYSSYIVLLLPKDLEMKAVGINEEGPRGGAYMKELLEFSSSMMNAITVFVNQNTFIYQMLKIHHMILSFNIISVTMNYTMKVMKTC